MTATTATEQHPTIDSLDHEPTDLAVRVQLEGTEWARDSRTGRWKPLGRGSSGYGWPALRMLFPDARVLLPAVSTGRTIPARRGDPATSKQATAAVTVRAGSQRARLLAAFGRNAADHLVDGLTDEQAARVADGVTLTSEYAKRCSELREAGLIEPTGETRRGASGLDRIVSRITPSGSKVLTSLNA